MIIGQVNNNILRQVGSHKAKVMTKIIEWINNRDMVELFIPIEQK